MAWSTPRTWAVGEVLTAGNMNTFVSNELSFLGPPDSVSTPGLWLIWDSVTAGVSLPAVSVTTSTIPNNFKHLFITWEGSSAIAASSDSMGVRINGDSGTHYYYQYIRGNSASVTTGNSSAGNVLFLGDMAGAVASSYRGGGLTIVSNYTVSAPHPVISIAGGFSGASSTSSFVDVISGMKGDTGVAITSLTFLTGSGNNLAPACRWSVYGVA